MQKTLIDVIAFAFLAGIAAIAVIIITYFMVNFPGAFVLTCAASGGLTALIANITKGVR